MADKPGKYAAALAAITQPASRVAGIVLPEEELAPPGKRSREGWRAKQVLLKADSVERANERLRKSGKRTDFSDLMQALLDAWLDAPT